LQGSLCWKTFLFPPLSKQTSFAKSSKQSFALDLINEEKETTYWTHKSTAWQNVFSVLIDLEQTGGVYPIGSEFDGILSCTVQTVPNGPNEIKMFKSASGHPFQHWIMLVPMPTNKKYSEYIPLFLRKFQALYQQTVIQSAYKSAVTCITQHLAIMNQILEDGNY